MNKENFIRYFKDWFLALAEIHGKEISDSTMAIYLRSLQDEGLSYEQIISALEKAFSSTKFFPKPAELIELAYGDTAIEETATTEAIKILGMIGSIGYYTTPRFSDPITTKIMKGKWQSICRTHKTKNDSFFIKDFIKQYKAIKGENNEGTMEITETTANRTPKRLLG